MTTLSPVTLFFVSILFFNSAFAENTPFDCKVSLAEKNTKSIDLRPEMPPLRDQGSIGWCYGFTAADLLTHYLYKTHGSSLLNTPKGADYLTKKFSVSGIGVASAFNETVKKNYYKDLKGKMLSELQLLNKKVFPEGGTIAEAIKAAKSSGICFEKDLSSEDFSYFEDYRCAEKKNCNANDILNIVYDTPRDVANCHDLFSIQKMFSSLDLNTIQKIISTSARENAINNLANASCKTHFSESPFNKQKGPEVETYNASPFNTPDKLMDTLDIVLNQGRPVGILYYAVFLVSENYSKNISHASTIVGKRFNPKTCEVEYILRNSWGSGCGSYSKDNPGFNKCMDGLKSILKANSSDKKAQQEYFNGVISCRKNNSPLPLNPRVACDDSGHAIVRRSDLAKQIYNITMIKEDNRH